MTQNTSENQKITMPSASDTASEQLDTFLTNRLLAMIEETLLTVIDAGVSYETYAAALVPILIGAASALNQVADTDPLFSSFAEDAERASKVYSMKPQ